MTQYPDSIEHKDPRIRELLHELEAALPAGSYQIVDHWDADACAIGVASPEDSHRLVYVSTYDQEGGTFAFECEAPVENEAGDYQVVEKGNGLELEMLLTKIRNHLRGQD